MDAKGTSEAMRRRPGAMSSLIDGWSKAPALPAACVLIAATILAYLPVLDAGFVFDDAMYLTGNSRMGTVDGLVSLWTDVGDPDYRHQYYPLTSTALWLQHQAWGLNPVGYHLVNVLLHALNAVLLWRVLRAVRLPGAWLAAAIFALHPVHVQSVAWVSEIKNVLSTFFFLSAALVFMRAFGLKEKGIEASRHQGIEGETGDASGATMPRALCWYAIGTLLFVCALLSKTATCILPVGLSLIVWWKRDRIAARDTLMLLPLLVLGAMFVMMTVYLEANHAGAQGELFSATWLDRCLIAGRSVWFYAEKLVWPAALTLIYPRWTVDTGVWWQSLYPAAAVAALVSLWVLRGRIGKGPFAAVIFFVLAVAPISFVNVAFTRFSYVADHWQYWASMGLIALGAAVVVGGGGGWRRIVPVRVATTVAAAAALGALGHLTWQRTHVFAGERALWADTLAKNPGSWQAHYNVGIAMEADGRLDDAIEHYRQAARIAPEESVVHNNLGIALCARGEQPLGLGHLQEAVRLDPRSVEAHVNYGQALISAGRFTDGMRYYQQAIRINPRFAGARFNLGIALRSDGRIPEAIQQFREALRLAPDAYEVHNNLGEALQAIGRVDEAIEHYHAALRIRPDWAAAHFNLAIALERRGQLDEAIAHYRRAVWIDAGHAEVHLRLGSALARTGNHLDAARHFRQVVRLQPESAPAWRSLAWLLATDPATGTGDPAEALRAARQAVASGSSSDATTLDVLAAAYAHTGRFDQAMPLAAQAVTLAAATGQHRLADEIGERLVLYGVGLPYRDEQAPAETAQTAGVLER